MKIEPPFYCQTYSEAHAEVQRRKSLAESEQLIHRITMSPYHGYVVRSVDSDMYVESVMDEAAAKASPLEPVFGPTLWPRETRVSYGRRP